MLPRPGRACGFSLVEVLVALTLLGVALLMGMQLVLQGPRIVRRTDAERQAFRAMESVLESVRAGLIPLENLEIGVLETAVGAPAPKDLKMLMTVAPTDPEGLYQVTLRTTYTALGVETEKTLQTMVWSP
ncbi:MAG TPA: type II secretion system protein [Thermoanaerobaculia bacterium]|nr:type II secretion system protein [Thermoanaerobaculia bacterium]